MIILGSHPNPFGLSLSKPYSFLGQRPKEERPFDRLKANGAGE
jgi:hypothetical protein